MSNKPYILLVTFTAKPAKEQALKTTLTDLAQATLKEEGCVMYQLHQHTSDPAQFMIYEIWQDKAAHTLHTQTPHIQAWRQQREDLLLTPNQVINWEQL